MSHIKTYYDNLADEYDHSRFANSYGRYVHAQEERILARYLSTGHRAGNLDLACGTGRFLSFAGTGVDLSAEMLQQARRKFPEAVLVQADARSLPFPSDSFANVFCFHLMMHLDNEALESILNETHHITRPGGCFIFDIPSAKRRALTGYRSQNWHGGHSASVQDIRRLCAGRWRVVQYHGVAFFPIHRIPSRFRPALWHADTRLGNSVFKEYASHLVFILAKI